MKCMRTAGISAIRRGFTLIEIILVVTIIMLLASMVLPRVTGMMIRSKEEITRIEMNNIKTALGQYDGHVGGFPTAEQGLRALVERPSEVPEKDWMKCMDDPPKDAWGHEFKYICPDESGHDFELVSAGRDGKFDTGDDLFLHKKTDGKRG